MATSPGRKHEIEIQLALPTHFRRSTSTILAEYPWHTTNIILNPKPLSADDITVSEFQNFISALQAFERNLLNFEQDQEIKATLALLGISVHHELGSSHSRIVCKHSDRLMNSEYHVLGSIVSAYRFYEILCLHHNVATPVPREMPRVPLYLPPSSQANETTRLRYYEHLETWPTTLSNFCNIVHESKPRVALTKPSSIAMMSLLDMIENNSNNAKYVAIADNFLLMALTIAALKHFPFKKGALPELPASCPLIDNVFPETLAGDNETNLPMRMREEYEDFRNAYNVFITKHRSDEKTSASSISFRNSFHLAVMISPIYLLAPCTLFKKAFNRRTIMETASCLGTHKPDSQKQTESLILEAVFRLAEGKTDIHVVFTELAKKLRNDVLEKSIITHTDASRFYVTEKLQYIGFANPLTSLSSCLGTTTVNEVPAGTTTSPRNAFNDDYDIFLALKNAWKYSPQYNLPIFPLGGTPDLQSVTSRPYGPLRLTDTGFNVIGEPSSHELRNLDIMNGSVSSSDTDAPFDVDDEYGALPKDPITTVLSMPGPSQTTEIRSSGTTTSNAPLDLDATATNTESDHTPPEESSDEEPLADRVDVQNRRKKLTSNIPGTDMTLKPSISSDTPSDDNLMPTSGKKSSGMTPHSTLPLPGLFTTQPIHMTRSATGTTAKRRPTRASSNASDSEDSDRNLRKTKKRAMLFDAQEDAEVYRVVKRPASPIPSIGTSGTRDNPIDVDSLISIFEAPRNYDYTAPEKITLAHNQIPQIPTDKQYTVFNSKGQSIEFSPRFHHEDQHRRFDQFMTRVQKGYVKEKASHITNKQLSVLKTYSYEEWLLLSVNQRHEILSERNVVVSGWPIEEPISFNEEGIRNVVGPSLRQISIQDDSILDAEDMTVSGYVEDILNNQGPAGKILNALDLPLFEMNTRRSVHTSDVHAWEITRGLHTIHPKTPYPREDMRWALAGLKNAMTYIHVDCDGLATDIHVLCGAKLWGFVRSFGDEPVQSPDFFLHHGFALDEVTPSSYYQFEAIVLEQGDRLFMRPGQPHWVYGLEDTLCEGGHHYLTHQMEETFQGLIHTFMLHDFLTNTVHHPSRTLLRRMVIFYHMGFLEHKVKRTDPAYQHLPKVETFKGLMDLLSACVLVILSNVLDLRTYQTPTHSEIQSIQGPSIKQALQEVDINCIPADERLAICYARGVALRLLEWIRDCAIVTDYSGKKIDDIATGFLHQTLNTLAYYNEKIVEKDLAAERPFEDEMFATQLDNIRTIFKPTWIIPEKVDVHYMGKPYDEHHVIWDEMPWTGGDQDFLKAGTTPLDRKYITAQKERKHYEKHFVLPRLQETQAPPPSKRAKHE